MYSAKNSCTATFSHLFIGPSSRLMESYSDGDERGNLVAGGGGGAVGVGWGGFSQGKNYKDQIINILELRKKEKGKKESRHHFLLFIFRSPDPHRTHWIFIVESIKWTDLRFLTLMIPQKEGSRIFRIASSLFLFFCSEKLILKRFKMPGRYFGLPIHKTCILLYVFRWAQLI